MTKSELAIKSELWDEYKYWIIGEQLKMPKDVYKPIAQVLDFLHNYTFTPPLSRDKNRVEDGMELRYIFFNNIIGGEGKFTKSPKVLEVLAALAIRMENEYIGDPGDPKPFIPFLDILDNLGLNKNNKFFNQYEADDILRDWLHNGKHLFDIGYFKGSDNMEIWSQMQTYIHERYS